MVEKYEIASHTWTFLDDVNFPGGDKALVELDGALFTVVGEDQVDPTCAPTINPPDPGEATVALDDVEMLDDSGSWTTVASIPHAWFRFDAEAVGSQIFVFGGQKAYNTTCWRDSPRPTKFLFEPRGLRQALLQAGRRRRVVPSTTVSLPHSCTLLFVWLA